MSKLNLPKNIKPIIIIAIITITALTACSSSAEKLNQDGNEAFTEQAYLEALDLYHSAQIESPELAEPYYNAANSLYRQGNYPEALQQMQMALQFVDEASLAESSFYNMGNSLFNSQELETAVEAYKQALLINPDDADAKYNLELALQQQQQQQQEQENQQNENQDQQDENQDQENSESGEDQKEEQQDQQDDGDQSENESGEENSQDDVEQDQDQNGNGGQQQESDSEDGEQQQSQVPAPGQRMTEEQAKQLLAAIAEDMETLQERLGQYFILRSVPPIQDW